VVDRRVFRGLHRLLRFAKHLFNALVFPYKWAVVWAHLDVSKAQLIYTAPQEFFFTQVKVAMFGGLVIAFPIIAAQIYKFVAPGLYKNERAAFLPFLIASPVLFLMGGMRSSISSSRRWSCGSS
jgi:sec-independent protein translocase protein TatC